jgi:hypothetical protein
MRNTAAATAGWWLIFTACGLVFTAHFALAQLSSMPISPLKLQLANVLTHYVDPYFTQRWNFFAPQPLDRDVALLARARYRNVTSGQLVTGPWINVTESLIEPLRSNRLTPLFHVEVSLSNAVLEFSNEMEKDQRATFQKDGQTYVKSQIAADIDPLDMQTMKRTALATLEIAYPGQNFEQVQLGIMNQVFPRFTARYKAVADGLAAVTLVDWQSAEWVAPYCCHRGYASAPILESKVQP